MPSIGGDLVARVWKPKTGYAAEPNGCHLIYSFAIANVQQLNYSYWYGRRCQQNETVYQYISCVGCCLQLKVHGQVLESLYADIPYRYLPAEYLPDDYTGPSQGSERQIIGRLMLSLQSR